MGNKGAAKKLPLNILQFPIYAVRPNHCIMI